MRRRWAIILAFGLCLSALGCNRGRGIPTLVTGPSSPPGWEVRYNATIALARRGSDNIKDERTWDTLLEMLDEDQQLRNFKHQLRDKKEVSDAGQAHFMLISYMQAIVELNRRRPDLDLSGLKPAIEKLAGSGSLAVSTQAKRTLPLFK